MLSPLTRLYSTFSTAQSNQAQKQRSEAVPADNPSVNIESHSQVNQASATLVGFIGRVLIEQSFFQNSQLPADLLFQFSNDLIKMISTQKASTFNLAQEIGIIWKETRGKPLTQSEIAYQNADKELDVVQEVANGLKYSSIALMGTQFYTSISSTIAGGMWNHVPSICAYFGATLVGPQAIAYAVNKTLENRDLTDTQKLLLSPWLSTIGHLALGFTPKVYANANGVHYHYPSLQGHTKTYSPYQTTTINGDTLVVESKGTLTTINGTFAGVHEVEFKLRGIQELTNERIRLMVLDQQGQEVPVIFERTHGRYGPEINVSCSNKELERYWAQYFTPRYSTLQLSNFPAETSLSQNLAVKQGMSVRNEAITSTTVKTHSDSGYANFALLSMLYVTSSLLKPRQLSPSQSIGAASVLMLPFLPRHALANPFKVDNLLSGLDDRFTVRWKAIMDVASFPIDLEDQIEKTGNEASITMDIGSGGQILIGKIEQTGGFFVIKLENAEELLLNNEGEVISTTIKDLTVGMEATLKVAGCEARLTVIEAASHTIRLDGELRRVFRTTMENINLSIGKAGDMIQSVAIQADQGANAFMVNFGAQSNLLIVKSRDTVNFVLDSALEKRIATHDIILSKTGKTTGLLIDRTSGAIEEVAITMQDETHKIAPMSWQQLMIQGPEAIDRIFYSLKANTLGVSMFDDLSLKFKWSSDQNQLDPTVKLARLSSNLKFVDEQNQKTLSALEKTQLYIQLINSSNEPGKTEDERKTLLFLIGAIASEDNELKTINFSSIFTKRSCFHAVLNNIPFDDVIETIKSGKYTRLIQLGIAYIRGQSARFASLALSQDGAFIQFEKLKRVGSIENDSGLPIGALVIYPPSSQLSADYLLCDGASYSTNAYPDLYSVIKNIYGKEVRQGIVYFRVPDYRDKFLEGKMPVIYLIKAKQEAEAETNRYLQKQIDKLEKQLSETDKRCNEKIEELSDKVNRLYWKNYNYLHDQQARD